MRREHDLKTWPRFFDDVLAWRKPFEVRLDDRGFAVGDVLNLREWDPDEEAYTGRSCRRRVSYVLRDWIGIERGYVVMGLSPVEG